MSFGESTFAFFVAYVRGSGVWGHRVCIYRYYQTVVPSDCTYLSTTIDTQEFQLPYLLTITWDLPSRCCIEQPPPPHQASVTEFPFKPTQRPWPMYKVGQFFSPTFLSRDIFLSFCSKHPSWEIKCFPNSKKLRGPREPSEMLEMF